MIKIFKKNIKNLSGFTLIESMVAIAILTAAMAGPMVLATRNIGSGSVSQDQLVAFYLGEEAIEYIRNVRDNDTGTGDDWLESLNTCTFANGCSIDAYTGTVDAFNSSSPQRLRFNNSSNRYDHIGTVNPYFIRQIKLDKTLNDNTEAKVTVIVTWKTRFGKDRNLTLHNHIFNLSQ